MKYHFFLIRVKRMILKMRKVILHLKMMSYPDQEMTQNLTVMKITAVRMRTAGRKVHSSMEVWKVRRVESLGMNWSDGPKKVERDFEVAVIFAVLKVYMIKLLQFASLNLKWLLVAF